MTKQLIKNQITIANLTKFIEHLFSKYNELINRLTTAPKDRKKKAEIATQKSTNEETSIGRIGKIINEFFKTRIENSKTKKTKTKEIIKNFENSDAVICAKKINKINNITLNTTNTSSNISQVAITPFENNDNFVGDPSANKTINQKFSQKLDKKTKNI